MKNLSKLSLIHQAGNGSHITVAVCILTACFTSFGTARADVTPVPEPSSFLLLSLGLMMSLFGWRRARH
ncbi:PEP-CTERM sorting domain-containing protein [Kiritimatiellaeota bacterium B1221]|nr:PEP-CTERM sorting domain-containing protein [Kiritimatiellaeota bacterium B1221]